MIGWMHSVLSSIRNDMDSDDNNDDHDDDDDDGDNDIMMMMMKMMMTKKFIHLSIYPCTYLSNTIYCFNLTFNTTASSSFIPQDMM
jgi:hypothetical protein